MNVGKVIKTEFFVYLNKELYKIAHSWEELEATEKEIFTKYSGYNLLYGSTVDFSVYINKKTKDVLTYWYRIRRTTNLKDSQGNVVCVKVRFNYSNLSSEVVKAYRIIDKVMYDIFRDNDSCVDVLHVGHYYIGVFYAPQTINIDNILDTMGKPLYLCWI